LAVLLAWSGILAARHTQSGDFAGFYQSWYRISHGTLNPAGWFQAQGILVQWPLAILGLVWPHPITLLVVQDLAIVGAEVVAFLWICDLLIEQAHERALAYYLTGLAMLVLDPWIYWSASWDYHSEALGTLFAILAARDLFRGRRIAVLWCLLTLLSGLITAPYLVGIGISLLIVRRRRIVGAVVAAVGAVWFEGMYKLGAGQAIGTLAGSKAHTATSWLGRVAPAFPAFFHYWVDAIANVAPAGLVGVFTTPAIGITAVTMGENFSQGTVGNVQPSFQSLPLYIFVPVGTIVALIWVQRRFGHRFANIVAALTVVNVAAWAAIWIPPVVSTWLRVSPSQADAITHIERLIPERDGVAVSQGIAGDFADRSHYENFIATPLTLRMYSPYTWVVVAPYAGVETATVAQSAQLIATVANDPNAKLEFVNSADVWAFRIRVPAHGGHHLTVGRPVDHYSASLFATYGNAVRQGPERSWYMEGNDHAGGPILWGDYFLSSVGQYRARVRLSGPGLAQVQLWNTTTNKELDAKQLRLSRRTQTVSVSGAITHSDPKHSAKALQGFGPFQIDPVKAYRGNMLEIRVYAESASTIKVLHVSLNPVG
jgi:hypothetical protein